MNSHPEALTAIRRTAATYRIASTDAKPRHLRRLVRLVAKHQPTPLELVTSIGARILADLKAEQCNSQNQSE